MATPRGFESTDHGPGDIILLRRHRPPGSVPADRTCRRRWPGPRRRHRAAGRPETPSPPDSSTVPVCVPGGWHAVGATRAGSSPRGRGRPSGRRILHSVSSLLPLSYEGVCGVPARTTLQVSPYLSAKRDHWKRQPDAIDFDSPRACRLGEHATAIPTQDVARPSEDLLHPADSASGAVPSRLYGILPNDLICHLPYKAGEDGSGVRWSVRRAAGLRLANTCCPGPMTPRRETCDDRRDAETATRR